MNETSPQSFKNYTRRCLYFFLVLLGGTGLMVAISFAPLASTLRMALILAVAGLNAAVVIGFLMHLISEKKAVYTLLIFTGIFFIGLMGLTLWAQGDVPHLKGY